MKTVAALRDSVRPAPGSIALGRTTYEEIVRRYGRPAIEGSAPNTNGKLTTLTYRVTQVGARVPDDGIIPQRTIRFHLLDGVLVGYAWTSSFLVDSTDFDERKIVELKKGQTTRAEVVALFGEPTGEYVHPLVVPPGEIGLVYLYQQTWAPRMPLMTSTSSKSLVVTLDGNGIVTDVKFEPVIANPSPIAR